MTKRANRLHEGQYFNHGGKSYMALWVDRCPGSSAVVGVVQSGSTQQRVLMFDRGAEVDAI